MEKAGSPLKPASNIPIYVASYDPKMIEITAKLADGWISESNRSSTLLLKSSIFVPQIITVIPSSPARIKCFSRLLSLSSVKQNDY